MSLMNGLVSELDDNFNLNGMLIVNGFLKMGFEIVPRYLLPTF